MKHRQQAITELLKAVPNFTSLVAEQIGLFLEHIPKAKIQRPWCMENPQKWNDAIAGMIGLAEFLKGCREDIFQGESPSPFLQTYPFLSNLEEAIRKLIRQCTTIPFDVWMLYENTLLCFTLLQEEMIECERDGDTLNT